MTTIEQLIEKAGGVRDSSSTRNKILLTPVQVKHKKGYVVMATAVGLEGERAGCVMIQDAKGGMWRPIGDYTIN